jgi:hypothetical protein
MPARGSKAPTQNPAFPNQFSRGSKVKSWNGFAVIPSLGIRGKYLLINDLAKERFTRDIGATRAIEGA